MVKRSFLSDAAATPKVISYQQLLTHGNEITRATQLCPRAALHIHTQQEWCDVYGNVGCSTAICLQHKELICSMHCPLHIDGRWHMGPML